MLRLGTTSKEVPRKHIGSILFSNSQVLFPRSIQIVAITYADESEEQREKRKVEQVLQAICVELASGDSRVDYLWDVLEGKEEYSKADISQEHHLVIELEAQRFEIVLQGLGFCFKHQVLGRRPV